MTQSTKTPPPPRSLVWLDLALMIVCAGIGVWQLWRGEGQAGWYWLGAAAIVAIVTWLNPGPRLMAWWRKSVGLGRRQ